MFWQPDSADNSLGKRVSAAPCLGQAAMNDMFSFFTFFITIIVIIIIIICFFSYSSSSSSSSHSGRKPGSDCSMQMVQWDGLWDVK
jgi:hypothetical protein